MHHEADRAEVECYLDIELPDDEQLTHLEKISRERVLEREYGIWDAHTTKGRWWVITNPTNLYDQNSFPSMDGVLSFHIGLVARIMSRHEPSATDEEYDRVTTTWRKWEQAANALDDAEEAEEFQAVGLRCREAMLSLIREVAQNSFVPDGQEPPKAGAFIDWSALVADAVAAGKSSEHMRSYLKKTAREAWDYVQWLTHASNATRFHADFAVEITEHLISNFTRSVVGLEREVPKRCPVCQSYKLAAGPREAVDADRRYVSYCTVCGWENTSTTIESLDTAPPASRPRPQS